MAKEVLRTVQPAYKSDRITVAQAKRAWLKVERDSQNGDTSSRSKRTPKSPDRAEKA